MEREFHVSTALQRDGYRSMEGICIHQDIREGIGNKVIKGKRRKKEEKRDRGSTITVMLPLL